MTKLYAWAHVEHIEITKIWMGERPAGTLGGAPEQMPAFLLMSDVTLEKSLYFSTSPFFTLSHKGKNTGSDWLPGLVCGNPFNVEVL